MKTELNLSKVVPIDEMVGDGAEDTILLKEMCEEAKGYLLTHSWCEEIKEGYFGFGIGGVVAIFLFYILPSQENIDEYVWIIVGDIPSLYITTEDAPNPACALDGYIGAMEEWVEAASEGKSVRGLPPVNAKASPENAANLKSRLEFLDKKILSHYQDDLD